MCGIVGVLAARPIVSDLVWGLKQLEYRGYDSAGIAVVSGGEIKRRRAAGNLANLSNLLANDPVEGELGIGHTRWATHGGPVVRNAHPHVSGGVAVVHNGIIENYRELKADLERDGYHFESETDTEVIAHLINMARARGSTSLEAFDHTLSKLRGAFALAVVFEDDPDLLLGVRKGSPLVIGLGVEGTYLCSDVMAMREPDIEIVFLEEGDSVHIRRTGVQIRDAAGRAVDRPRRMAERAEQDTGKGAFSHYMMKEIHEQPEAIYRSLAPFIDANKGQLLPQPALAGILQSAERIISVGCGSAYIASVLARRWFEQLAKVHFESDIASEFRYRQPVLSPNVAALFISQSGETADTLSALRHCTEIGVPTLAVVNVRQSSVAREVDLPLFTTVGPEICVASTKAFTSQQAVLAALALLTAKSRGNLDPTAERAFVDSLLGLSHKVQETLACGERVREVVPMFRDSRSAIFMGRGSYHALALEGALKLKELSYIHAEAFAAGELKHGALALVDEKVPVVVVAPMSAEFEKVMSNVEEVRARGAKVLLISNAAGMAAAKNRFDLQIQIPDGDELTQPILATIPLQFLSYYVALERGNNIDQPRNLAKSVTVE